MNNRNCMSVMRQMDYNSCRCLMNWTESRGNVYTHILTLSLKSNSIRIYATQYNIVCTNSERTERSTHLLCCNFVHWTQLIIRKPKFVAINYFRRNTHAMREWKKKETIIALIHYYLRSLKWIFQNLHLLLISSFNCSDFF